MLENKPKNPEPSPTRGLLPPPVITTERLHLRPLSEEDIPAYERYFIDYEVIRNLTSTVPWPYPADGIKKYFHDFVFPNQGKDRWIWAINEKHAPEQAIGCIDLWREGKPENRGFWLGRPFWGKGYMTEAAEAVMDFAFGPAGFETLVFSNARANHRSSRVKEKTGARLVSVEPASFVDPALTEREVWELTKNEWERFKR